MRQLIIVSSSELKSLLKKAVYTVFKMEIDGMVLKLKSFIYFFFGVHPQVYQRKTTPIKSRIPKAQKRLREETPNISYGISHIMKKPRTVRENNKTEECPYERDIDVAYVFRASFLVGR